MNCYPKARGQDCTLIPAQDLTGYRYKPEMKGSELSPFWSKRDSAEELEI